MDPQFKSIDRRFKLLEDDVNRRFKLLEDDVNRQFKLLEDDVNRRFKQIEDVNRKFKQLEEKLNISLINQRIDTLENNSLVKYDKEIENNAVDRVMSKVYKDIVPKINTILEVQRYQTQDGDELINAYRYGVHMVSEKQKSECTDSNSTTASGSGDIVQSNCDDISKKNRMLFFDEDD